MDDVDEVKRQRLLHALWALTSQAAREMEPEAGRVAVVALGLAADLLQGGGGVGDVVDTLQALRNQATRGRR